MVRKSNKGFVVPIVVFIVAIIAVGASIYYFYTQNKNTEYFGENVKAGDSGYRAPLSKLDEAKLKAAKSRSLFDSLVNKYLGEQKAVTSIQEEYSKMTDLLPSATVVIMRKKLPADIQKQISDIQSKINAALTQWNAELALAHAKNPTVSLADLIAEAKKQSALIDAYTKELQDIINTLTPENSGLSQNDIDTAKKAAQKAADDAKKEEVAIQAIEDAAKKANDAANQVLQNVADTNTPLVTPKNIEDAKIEAKKAEDEKKKEEEAAGIKKDVPLPTPTADNYSSYDNNKYKTPTDPHYYDDIVSSGKPEIDGSPSKK